MEDKDENYTVSETPLSWLNLLNQNSVLKSLIDHFIVILLIKLIIIKQFYVKGKMKMIKNPNVI